MAFEEEMFAHMLKTEKMFGSIQSQLEEGSRKHKQISETLDTHTRLLTKVPENTKRIDDVEVKANRNEDDIKKAKWTLSSLGGAFGLMITFKEQIWEFFK